MYSYCRGTQALQAWETLHKLGSKLDADSYKECAVAATRENPSGTKACFLNLCIQLLVLFSLLAYVGYISMPPTNVIGKTKALQRCSQTV